MHKELPWRASECVSQRAAGALRRAAGAHRKDLGAQSPFRQNLSRIHDLCRSFRKKP
jgi:hypothetical protein